MISVYYNEYTLHHNGLHYNSHTKSLPFGSTSYTCSLTNMISVYYNEYTLHHNGLHYNSHTKSLSLWLHLLHLQSHQYDQCLL